MLGTVIYDLMTIIGNSPLHTTEVVEAPFLIFIIEVGPRLSDNIATAEVVIILSGIVRVTGDEIHATIAPKSNSTGYILPIQKLVPLNVDELTRCKRGLFCVCSCQNGSNRRGDI